MQMDIMKRIGNTGLVPVVVIDDIMTAVPTAKALYEGGVDIMEITLRTPAGLESIFRVAQEFPEMLVGAGTVIDMEQCTSAIKNGAQFIVSPGYDPEIVEYCISKEIPVCPGCVTPTEIMAAMKKGLRVLKFFPANIYGGIKAIKALAGPFTGIEFIPTGGVDISNLADFTSSPVYAIGGGWLCARNAINSGKYDTITDVCRKSIDILLHLKKDGNEITLDDLIQSGGTATTVSLPRTASQLERRGFEVAETSTGLVCVNNFVTIIISNP